MNPLSSVILIGSYAPQQCGIATFTQDLRNAITGVRPLLEVAVAMVAKEAGSLPPPEVRYRVEEQDRAGYAALGKALNASGAGLVSLQHEYGIFGGPDGAWILDTLRALRLPVVTTCHTVLSDPSPGQHLVLSEIGRRSAGMVVMTARGRDLLCSRYGVAPSKITLIPHGIPDTDPAELDRAALRQEMGWAGHKVILTTGLLSANKGIQHAIAAMPRILAAHPDALYVVAGATHPNLVRQEGESVRQGLTDLAEALGVADRVQFINRFAARGELVRLIVAADLFVTPYLSEAQATSGVLAYASGLGKPVISTPYWHARELLDDTCGVMVPFASSGAIAEAAVKLFDDPERSLQMSVVACRRGRETTWGQAGRQYLEAFDSRCGRSPLGPSGAEQPAAEVSPAPLPLAHLHRLTGPLGIYQHAKLAEPDLEHGYCTDDNARALILARDLLRSGHPDKMRLTALEKQCFEFVSGAFNPLVGRFRNFRSAAGEWLEAQGSEDSHGRALWALGHSARHAPDPVVQQAAVHLFHLALPAVDTFTAPRAWTFTLLGLAALPAGGPPGVAAAAQRHLAARLMRLYHRSADRSWRWFEPSLSYDNARLPQALLVTAAQTGDTAMRTVALNSLAWLMHLQRAPEGHFRAIGSNGFFHRGSTSPAQWDQQPLEALASLSACLEAQRLTGREEWLTRAQRALAWFSGANDLGLPVGNDQTGACYDGIQPGGMNQNQGAESTLAFLQSHTGMRLWLAMRCRNLSTDEENTNLPPARDTSGSPKFSRHS